MPIRPPLVEETAVCTANRRAAPAETEEECPHVCSVAYILTVRLYCTCCVFAAYLPSLGLLSVLLCKVSKSLRRLSSVCSSLHVTATADFSPYTITATCVSLRPATHISTTLEVNIQMHTPNKKISLMEPYRYLCSLWRFSQMFSSLQTGYQKRLSARTARPWALNTALINHTQIEEQRKHLYSLLKHPCIGSLCIQQLEITTLKKSGLILGLWLLRCSKWLLGCSWWDFLSICKVADRELCIATRKLLDGC